MSDEVKDKKRAELEEKISNTILFSLDEKLDSSAYKRESDKLILNIYKYVELTYVNSKDKSSKDGKFHIENYGLEITDTAKRCIKNYNPEGGDFLHYFNASWKLTLSQTKVNTTFDNQHYGLSVSDNDKRSLRNLCFYINKKNINVNSPEFIENAAKNLGISEKNIKKLIELSANVKSESDYVLENDGESAISIFDFVADKSQSIDVVEDAASCLEVMRRIEKCFLDCQERQRPILSMILTSKLPLEVVEVIETVSSKTKFTFVDKNLIEQMKQGQEPPTQKEIAEKMGVKESSASRTIKEFLNKIVCDE